jgi:plasmid stabilization system protein ParE
MVEVNKLELIWSPSAMKDLKKAYNYIKKESKVGAKKVVDSIFDEVEKLTIQPKIFELDRFKNNNPGNYRAFEKYHYRISYKHTETELHVLRVRHTSKNPLTY